MLSKEQSVGKCEREKVRRNLWLGNEWPTHRRNSFPVPALQAVIDISSHPPKMMVSSLCPEVPGMCARI